MFLAMDWRIRGSFTVVPISTAARRRRPASPRSSRRWAAPPVRRGAAVGVGVYAKHVLRLQPLDAVDTPPGARDRGTTIHAAVGDFTKPFAQSPPPDALETLVGLGEKHFADLADYPEARAFWWPR